MNLNIIYQKKNNIVTRHIAGETLLVPISSHLENIQNIFVLNDVAEYIWQNLDGKQTLKEIQNGILSKFDVKKEKACIDIQEFISRLSEANLIVTVHK